MSLTSGLNPYEARLVACFTKALSSCDSSQDFYWFEFTSPGKWRNINLHMINSFSAELDWYLEAIRNPRQVYYCEMDVKHHCKMVPGYRLRFVFTRKSLFTTIDSVSRTIVTKTGDKKENFVCDNMLETKNPTRLSKAKLDFLRSSFSRPTPPTGVQHENGEFEILNPHVILNTHVKTEAVKTCIVFQQDDKFVLGFANQGHMHQFVTDITLDTHMNMTRVANFANVIFRDSARSSDFVLQVLRREGFNTRKKCYDYEIRFLDTSLVPVSNVTTSSCESVPVQIAVSDLQNEVVDNTMIKENP